MRRTLLLIAFTIVACKKPEPAATTSPDAAAPATASASKPEERSVAEQIREMKEARHGGCKKAAERGKSDTGLVLAVNGQLDDKMKGSGKPYEIVVLSKPEQMIFAVSTAELEVFNGGFDQYFANSSGADAAALLEGLQAIGDTKSLAAAKKVFAPFPGGKPDPDRAKRYDQLDAIKKARGEAWDEAATHEYRDDDLTRERNHLLATYIRAHCAEIDAPLP